MGKLTRASVFVLLLAHSASAGVMINGVAPPPPPPPVQGIMQMDAAPPPPQSEGIMQYDAAPLLVQIALNLLTLL